MNLENTSKVIPVITINKPPVSNNEKIYWGESLCKLTDSNQVFYNKLYNQVFK